MDLQDELLAAIAGAGGAPKAPRPGKVGWARSPGHDLWPCVVVDPSKAAEVPELSPLPANSIVVSYFQGAPLGRDDDDDSEEIDAIPPNSFVAWGSAHQHVIEFCSMFACVSESSTLTVSFLRSVEEAHLRMGGGVGTRRSDGSDGAGAGSRPVQQPFVVAWNEVLGYPLWPCVSVHPSVARYFAPDAPARHPSSAPVVFFDDQETFDVGSIQRKGLAELRFGSAADAERVVAAREDLASQPDVLRRFEVALALARRLHAALTGRAEALDAEEEAEGNGPNAYASLVPGVTAGVVAAAAATPGTDYPEPVSRPTRRSSTPGAAGSKRRRGSTAAAVDGAEQAVLRREDVAAAILAEDEGGAGVSDVIVNLRDDQATKRGHRGLIPALLHHSVTWTVIRGAPDATGTATVATVHAVSFGSDLLGLLQRRRSDAGGSAPPRLSWADVEALLKNRDPDAAQSGGTSSGASGERSRRRTFKGAATTDGDADAGALPLARRLLPQSASSTALGAPASPSSKTSSPYPPAPRVQEAPAAVFESDDQAEFAVAAPVAAAARAFATTGLAPKRRGGRWALAGSASAGLEDSPPSGVAAAAAVPPTAALPPLHLQQTAATPRGAPGSASAAVAVGASGPLARRLDPQRAASGSAASGPPLQRRIEHAAAGTSPPIRGVDLSVATGRSADKMDGFRRELVRWRRGCMDS